MVKKMRHWFMPGPLEEEPDDLPPGPRAEPPDTAVIDDWAKAEGVHAARLAGVAGRLGALDDRLLRGPEGWQYRLALIEAADLSWFAGDRVSADRLALWVSMRLSGAQDASAARACNDSCWRSCRLAAPHGEACRLSTLQDANARNAPGIEYAFRLARSTSWHSTNVFLT